MTDRRQEAIEMIATWMCCGSNPDKASLGEAEALYDRLSTLREFPEELFAAQLESFYNLCKTVGISDVREKTLADFKRLWHCREAMEPEPLIDHRLFKEAKGGCPMCGGTRRIPQSEKSKEEGFVTFSTTNDYPCPACRGERRKGVRRKDTGKRDYDRANHTNDIDGCAPQYETLKGKTLDRRISEEKRK